MKPFHRPGGLTPLPFLAAAFVAVVCIAILALSGWRELASRDVELKNVEVDLSNLARSLTQHAEDTIELADTILKGIVSGQSADGETPASIARLQRILDFRKATLGRIRGLFVYDESGRWLATTEKVNLDSFNNNDRDYFQHHKTATDSNLFIGRPVQSRSGGQWVNTLSRRLNSNDGGFAGVVLATVDVAYFSQFYAQFDIGPHGTISLISTDGIVLARSPDDGSIIGRDLSNTPLFREMRSRSASGVYYYRSTLDGRQRLSFYEQSDRFPVMVVAAKAQDDVLARWRREAGVRIAFVLGLVLIIAVIGFYLVRQLIQGQRMAAALSATEADFRILAEESSDMVTRIGLDGKILYVSPSSISIVGWRPDQLLGTPALAGVKGEDLPALEQTVAELKRGKLAEARVTYRTRHREKQEIWIESSLRVTREPETGKIDGVVAISRDMTQRKNLEMTLSALAIEDGLTSIANRRHFDARLQEEWARAARDGTSLSLLLLDVDHFKKFNDQYGHPAGDECLRSIAGVLASQARRAGDLPARYGGEEFALLLPDTDAPGCRRVGEGVRLALAALGIAHALNPPSKRVTISLGGATVRPILKRTTDCSTLVDSADHALYEAKNGGRDRLVVAEQTYTVSSNDDALVLTS